MHINAFKKIPLLDKTKGFYSKKRVFHGVSDRFVVRLFWWPPGFPKDSDFTAQEWRFSEWRTQVAVNLMEPLSCGGVVLPPLGGKVGKVGLI